ncbi:MAG: hypothetical protein EOO29_48215, partial [Comamonadaceae bacterium]
MRLEGHLPSPIRSTGDKPMNRPSRFRWIAAALSALCLCGAASAQTPAAKVRIAVVTPLTGPLSVVNGPGQNAARLLAEAINKGELPAPYNTGKGFGGREIELVFLDENGGNAKQVAEFRALVERQGADVVMGFGSAATCLAIAPVAEELKVLTVMSTCATPRIFEDGKYEYVFRTTGTTTMDSVAQVDITVSTFNSSATGAMARQVAAEP